MTSGSKHYWTSGNAVSWVGGVLLGGLIGTVLLIAIPRSMGGVASTETAAAAPAASAPAAAAPAATPAAPAENAEGAAKSEETTATAAGEGDEAAGKAKYAATCAACHGANAEGGMGGLAPALGVTKTWTPEQFTAAVRELKAPNKELKAPMMKFTPDQVSDADVANIHAFLKSVN